MRGITPPPAHLAVAEPKQRRRGRARGVVAEHEAKILARHAAARVRDGVAAEVADPFFAHEPEPLAPRRELPVLH